MALAPRWLRARTGVRVASALSAAAVVALALVVAGMALILLVGRSLSRSVQDDAVQQAQAIAERMHGNYGKRVNGEYTPKENAVEAIDTLVGTGDPALGQIVVDYSDEQDGSGWALQTGSDAAPPNTVSDLTPDVGQTTVDPSALVPQADGTQMHAVLVAVGGATTTDDPMHFVVLYAAPLAAVDAAQGTVLYYLLFGVPILILVVGAATYVFAGRALRPVEAIRARVASMSEKDLAQRVPVPAARDEVGRLAETMNAMIARLENAQQAQRRFVADASHELRSPLATIGAGLELLQDSDPDTVTALRAETERIGRLVDDLLLLARADERGMQPRQDEVDIDEFVEGERTRPSDGDVRTEVRAEHVRVVGDRGQLVRVLRNLVDNAHRHARSRVLVTLGRERGYAALDVADDGPGVPAADRIRIFERFVRLDDARARADGGSGLGLAIVAEVVAAHRGMVWVDDAPGGGAVFRVRLPAAELPVDDLAEAVRPGVGRAIAPGHGAPIAPAAGRPGQPSNPTAAPAAVPAARAADEPSADRIAAPHAGVGGRPLRAPRPPRVARRDVGMWSAPAPAGTDDLFADWVPPQPPEHTPAAALGPQSVPGRGAPPEDATPASAATDDRGTPARHAGQTRAGGTRPLPIVHPAGTDGRGWRSRLAHALRPGAGRQQAANGDATPAEVPVEAPARSDQPGSAIR
jgi:signal transduction histidine kinase